MFHQFSNINGVTDVLHPVYRDQVNQSIKQAGPLLYVLEVYERFEKHSSPLLLHHQLARIYQNFRSGPGRIPKNISNSSKSTTTSGWVIKTRTMPGHQILRGSSPTTIYYWPSRSPYLPQARCAP